jgi:hypothetical protein
VQYLRTVWESFLNLFPAAYVLLYDWGGKGNMTKSIVCTYPDFRELPRGVKQMLVASEDWFFGEVQTSSLKINGREVGNRHLWETPQKQFSANGYAAFSA